MKILRPLAIFTACAFFVAGCGDDPKPEVPAEKPEVPAETPEVPAEKPEVPAEEPEVPAEEPEVPAETPEVPAETPEVPAEEPEVPAETPAEPAEEPEDAAAADTAKAGVADWPQWGRDPSKNMAAEGATGISIDIDPGKRKADSEEIDMTTTKGALWVAKLGSQSYGTATVADGKVFVGTNNESPRDSRIEGDRGIVYCLDEKTGELLWQLTIPKLGAGKVSDWELLGICSSATIIGNRGYVITNRCEVLCFDVDGLANGNDGMQDEGKYMAGPGVEPLEVTPTDADIIWVYDMRAELGVFPHNIASSSVLYPGFGDQIFATTSNGVDWTHTNIPAPQAPSLIALNKDTGELTGEQDPIVSERVLHCSWSSPTYGEVGGKKTVIFGGGDGWAYGLGLEAKEDDEGFAILPEMWRYDCNPPEYRNDPATGEPIKYTEYEGASEVIGTPVVYNGKVYVNIGQDPEHGEGVGMLSCLEPPLEGDLSGKALWTFKGVERTLSTPAIADGLVYLSDYSGRLFCLDAETGEKYWEFDTKGHIWGSALVADGKVFLGNEEGELYILKAGKEMEELAVVEFSSPIYATPIVANGTLYVGTQTHLYAFGGGDAANAAPEGDSGDSAEEVGAAAAKIEPRDLSTLDVSEIPPSSAVSAGGS